MYKVGPALIMNHGMGFGSLSIAMHELIKMLHYADARDVSFLRLGTCGGVGQVKIYSGGPFSPKNVENRAKKSPCKKWAFSTKNESLMDFSYNSLIFYKIPLKN